MKQLTAFFFFSVLIFSFQLKAFYWIRPQYQFHEFSWTGQYLQTDENFTSQGSYFDKLPSSQYMKNANILFNGRWVLSPSWGFTTSTKLAASESFKKETDGSTSKRSNSQFCCLNLGLDYLLISRSYMEIYPIFYLEYPLTRNKVDVYNVSLSEGSMDLSTQLLTRFRIGSSIPYFYFGWILRDEGRSSLVPYGLGLEFEGRSWNLGLLLQGYSSVTKDASTDNSQSRNLFISNANAGSQLFYGINPSLLEVDLYGSFQHSRTWRSLLGVAASINGAQSAKYMRAYLGMNIQFGNKAAQKRLVPSIPAPEEESFREDIENVIDQKLFEDQKNQK